MDQNDAQKHVDAVREASIALALAALPVLARLTVMFNEFGAAAGRAALSLENFRAALPTKKKAG